MEDEVNTPEQNLMLDAVNNGDLDEVKRLLPSIENAHDIWIDGGNSLLYHSINDYDMNIFEYIAKNTDWVRENDPPFLLEVIEHGNYTEYVIETILKYIEDINVTDYNGNTALMLIINDIIANMNKYGNISELYMSVINLLLRHGADPWIKNIYHDNSIMLVCYSEIVNLAEILLNANTPVKHFVDISLLNRVVLVNNYDLIELLLKHVKDINERENGNMSLLDVALASHIDPDIIELLRLSGAVG